MVQYNTVVQNGCKYYGIGYSYGLDIDRPLYGLILGTEGYAPQWKNFTAFGVFFGKEKDNPKNLCIDSFEIQPDGLWGQSINVLSKVENMEIEQLFCLFRDAIQKNDEIIRGCEQK